MTGTIVSGLVRTEQPTEHWFDFNGRLSTSEWRFNGRATLVRHYDPESSPPRMTFCEVRIDEEAT